MSRSDALPIAALALAVMVFFAPALFGDRAIFPWNMDHWLPWAATASPADLERPGRLADCARQFAVMDGLRTEALRAGRIPLWNRWIFLGTPFLANFQPGVFYPPNLLLAASGLDLPDRMTAYLAFHLLVAVTGLYVFLRGTGVRPEAALIGAVTFGWSGYAAARTGIPTMVATGAWLPWAWAATRRWVAREDGPAFAGMAGSIAMAGLAGFAQIFVFVVYGWAAAALAGVLFRRPRASRRAWAGLALAPLAGLLVVAVQLVPTLEFSRLAQDATNTAAMLSSGTLHPWALGKLVVPDLLGNPVDGNNATYLLSVGDGTYFQTERSTAVYVGILPLMLAGIVALSPGGRRRVSLAALVVAAGGLVWSLDTPLTRLGPVLPGLGFSRPDRAAFLWCAGIATLAGLGADRLAGREGPGWSRAANGLALVIGVAAFAFAAVIGLGRGAILPERIVATVGAAALARTGLAAALVAATALLAHAARASGRMGGRPWLAAALVLVTADLGVPAAKLNVMQPEESVFRPATPGGSLAFLAERRAQDGPFRILRHEPGPTGQFAGVLPPSTGALYGVEDAIGFDSINLERLKELMVAIDPAIVVKRGNFRGPDRSDVFALPVLDLLGVRYVLAREPAPLPGLRLVHLSDLAIHENPDVLPRVFLVDEVRVVPSPVDLVRAMVAPSFRPDRWAYAEAPVPGVAVSAPGSFRTEYPDPGSARLVAQGDERVVVEVAPARPGLLVLADAHYPGWKAFVDGAERPIHRVDHVFRGVAVAPGDREVVFAYDPRSFRIGAGLSLAGLVLLVAGTAVCGRGRSRPRPRPEARRSEKGTAA